MCVPQVTCSSSLGSQGVTGCKELQVPVPRCASLCHHGASHKGMQIRHWHRPAGHRDVRAGGQLSPDPVGRIKSLIRQAKQFFPIVSPVVLLASLHTAVKSWYSPSQAPQGLRFRQAISQGQTVYCGVLKGCTFSPLAEQPALFPWQGTFP